MRTSATAPTWCFQSSSTNRSMVCVECPMVKIASVMPMPKRVQPMLARLSKMPLHEEQYGFEIKWDGIRAVVYSGKRDSQITIEDRNLRDITFKYPELATLAGLNAVIDGEIVALDERGRPSFERLQGRMHLSSEAAVHARVGEIPVR